MISLHEARSLIAAHTPALPPEQVALAQAHGRVLREEVRAAEDFPAFDRSAMDGYAVALDDPSERFSVVGEVQAGQAPGFAIGRGECARIFTGATIPSGASQVIMQEDVRRDGDFIVPLRRGGRTHIRRRGEDARRGDVLLHAGMRLGAGEIALLAQIGAVQPLVAPAPRVLHFTTGDELVDPATVPSAGQIRDSNSTLVAALLRERGARLVHQSRCGDDLAALVTQVRECAEESAWDVLLLSGGASVGDYDFGPQALAELGFKMHFRRIALRPGKPLVFATRGRQVAFVIPGNPVSHFVTFHVAIRLALECLEGAPESWPQVALPLEGEMPGGDPRETFWPAQVAFSGGEMRARPLAWQSSGDLRGLVGANALIRIAPAAVEATPDGRAQCLLLACG